MPYDFVEQDLLGFQVELTSSDLTSAFQPFALVLLHLHFEKSISVIEFTSISVLKMPCLNWALLPNTKPKHWDAIFLDFFYLLFLPMVFSLCKTWVEFNEPSYCGLSLFIIIAFDVCLRACPYLLLHMASVLLPDVGRTYHSVPW